MKDEFRRESAGSWQQRLKSFAVYILIATVLIAALTATRSVTESLEQLVLSRHILNSADMDDTDTEAIVIMCTDKTIQKLSPDSGWPISRSFYSALLDEHLSRSSVVVFDILFADEGDANEDLAFAQAIERHGRVVLARSSATLPYEALLDSGAHIGYAMEFNEESSDAVSRRYKLFVNNDHTTGPTLITAAMLVQGYTIDYRAASNSYKITSPQGDAVTLSVDADGYFYRVPSVQDQAVKIIDLYDVYNGNYQAGLFDGKTVFIGGTVAGFEDIVYAPDFSVTGGIAESSSSMRVTGTKYLTDSYLTALKGFSPLRLDVVWETVICSLLFLAAAFISVRFSVKYSWAILLALCALWAGLCRLLFTAGLCYLIMIMPFVSVLTAFLLVLILNMLKTTREWMVSSAPNEALYRLSYELENIDITHGFEHYIHSFSDNIFKQLGTRILYAQITGKDPFFRTAGLTDSDEKNAVRVIRTRSITRQYRTHTLIVIPLPVFSSDERDYTVLATDRRISNNWVQSITALVLAMYVYFKAQKNSAEKQQMVMTMISMVIQMIDAKDPVTAGHSRRVSQYSRQIAEWLGFEPRRATDVEFAALLHDIGKIGVDDSVLNKPGVFTRVDYEKMKAHPIRGAEIVRTVGLSEEILDGVLHHHENLNGSGYPDGTEASGLTDFAKIIKVADVYDALTSKRQYKSAWDSSRALDVIYNGMDTEFDRHIAGVFIENIAPEGYVPNSSAGQHDEELRRKAEIIVGFARDKWSRVSETVAAKHGTMFRLNEHFSFDCAGGFGGIEWGERFGSEPTLKDSPSILRYDNEDQSVYVAMRAMRDDIINNAVYYYRKGCLSAGMITLRPGMTAIAEERLNQWFGSSTLLQGVRTWNKGGNFAVMFSSEGIDVVAFVTGYLANEIQ